MLLLMAPIPPVKYLLPVVMAHRNDHLVVQSTPANIPGSLWANKKSGVVHKCSAGPYATVCGRSIDEGRFQYFADGCSFSRARCSSCFKGEVITSREGMVNIIDAGLKTRARRQ